ncbi:hypothetical protein ACFONC_14245 [Luteimonas soli]|uniref:Uncharacterized protein n=1 Tax=Luteimonas soli TaxID=1648966 RepID=A0ABV7XQM7_9GAMM
MVYLTYAYIDQASQAGERLNLAALDFNRMEPRRRKALDEQEDNGDSQTKDQDEVGIQVID